MQYLNFDPVGVPNDCECPFGFKSSISFVADKEGQNKPAFTRLIDRVAISNRQLFFSVQMRKIIQVLFQN